MGMHAFPSTLGAKPMKDYEFASVKEPHFVSYGETPYKAFLNLLLLTDQEDSTWRMFNHALVNKYYKKGWKKLKIPYYGYVAYQELP